MAATDFPLNHPQARKTWSADLFKEALKRTQIIQFMGSGTESMIQIQSEVNKAAGDRIRTGLRHQLAGDGIQGDGTLEGNEEALEIYSDDVYIDQLRHAVKSAGKMSEQRVPFSVRAEARDGLADWWADRIDLWGFNQLGGNTDQSDTRYTGNQATIAPDADHILIGSGTGSTSEASISATTVAKMNLAFIDAAVERAKLLKNTLRPITVSGKKYLVLFLHPAQVTSLRTNTNTGQWLDIQKQAMAGGKVNDNPIFSGALGVYNGVIMHESTRLQRTPLSANSVASAGASGLVRRALLCGAQSASVAFGRGHGKNTFSWKEELFDYGNQLGVAAGCIGGLKKLRYNGSDFGVMVIPTYDPLA